MAPPASQPVSEGSFEGYTRLLMDLFKIEGLDLLELTLTLLRVGEIGGDGWDTLDESRAMLEDLIQLNQLELPPHLFPAPEKTHWRLHLLSYVHLIEMGAPYHILANLLRLRVGMRYTTRPFRETGPKPLQKQKRGHAPKLFTPSPYTKIGDIKMLASKAGFGILDKVFDEIYHSPIRNSVAHSDYVLHTDDFRMLNQRIPDMEDPSRLISSIPYERMEMIVAKAYDFYTAFFSLLQITREEMSHWAGKAIPYNSHLKGLLEICLDGEGSLNGFVLHWPNGEESFFIRDGTKTRLKNVAVAPTGEIILSPRVLSPALRGDFSPLLKKGEEPRYTSLRCERVHLEEKP